MRAGRDWSVSQSESPFVDEALSIMKAMATIRSSFEAPRSVGCCAAEAFSWQNIEHSCVGSQWCGSGTAVKLRLVFRARLEIVACLECV